VRDIAFHLATTHLNNVALNKEKGSLAQFSLRYRKQKQEEGEGDEKKRQIMGQNKERVFLKVQMQ
jgi:hypothetical protein